MNKLRMFLISLVVTAAIVVIPALAIVTSASDVRSGGRAHERAAGPEHVVAMYSSTIYDATDPAEIARNTDLIFVGTVVEELGRKGQTTEYSVGIHDPMDSGLDGEVTIIQPGWREGSTVYQAIEQPLLEIGEKYLLAVNVEGASGKVTLSAGPISGSKVTDGNSSLVIALDSLPMEIQGSERAAEDLAERQDFIDARDSI